MRAMRTAAFASLAVFAVTTARADDLVVFAAASLTNALNDAAKICGPQAGAAPKISYAGSLALARQIEQGAPADLFISADEDSMDYAQQKNLIQVATRADVLANDLVVVAPKNAAINDLKLTKGDLAKALGSGKLATGDVSSVPVGKYAKAAFEKLGLWSTVEPHLALSDNVRAALAFVARGEAPLGVVYATDAKAEPGVKVVATFPADSHPPITYPFALTAGTKGDAAGKFLACLRSAPVKPAFENQGFKVLPSGAK